MESKVAGLRERVPWWIKLTSKLVLSRLPISYGSWRALGIFRHGSMLSSEYARDVFQEHLDRARSHLPASFRVLELGPGDSLATAVLAAAEGAGETFLVDTGNFAERDVDAYQPLLETVQGLFTVDPADLRDVDALMRACRAHYLTDGLHSLRAMGDDSIHLAFSQAVLEHTLLDEFEETVRELHRVQAPGGIGSHQIDLRDHLGNSLHSLRFSQEIWESPAFRSSGFYTNRLRASQILDTFRRAGYEIVSSEAARWPALPLPRRALHPSFRGLADEDLLTFSLNLAVRKTP